MVNILALGFTKISSLLSLSYPAAETSVQLTYLFFFVFSCVWHSEPKSDDTLEELMQCAARMRRCPAVYLSCCFYLFLQMPGLLALGL